MSHVGQRGCPECGKKFPPRLLILQLSHAAFMEIKEGGRRLEYRPRNSYWARRLEGKHYDRVIFTDGFPPKKDKERRIEAPYRGFVATTLEIDGRGDPRPVYGILTPNHPKTGSSTGSGARSTSEPRNPTMDGDAHADGEDRTTRARKPWTPRLDRESAQLLDPARSHS